MDENTRARLEEPFPRKLHRTRKGSHGKELKYVEVAHYIRRLNEAAGGEWSFEVVEHKVLDNEVVVLGRLTLGSITKEAFGGSAITTARESGKPLSIADDLKSAAADALKKCASFLGIGLELHTDLEEDPEPVPRREPENVRPLRPPRTPPPKESAGKATAGSTASPITGRQAAAIQKLGTDLGMSVPELRTIVLKLTGIPLEKLSTRQASEIIGELQARMTGRPGRSAARGAA